MNEQHAHELSFLVHDTLTHATDKLELVQRLLCALSCTADCKVDILLIGVIVMHAINRIGKKRRQPTKMCHFKDTQGFKSTSASTIRSHVMMRCNSLWSQFPKAHILSKVSDVNEKGLYILHKSILQEDVGVVDDNKFLEEFKKSLAFDELLSMCNDIVQRHNSVMRRTAYSAKSLNDPSCQKILRLRDARLVVQRNLLSVFPSKLLGSKTNWQKFLMKIKSLMHQGYSGVLLVDTMMKGIKQSDIPWLRSLRYNGQRQRIIAKILRWIVIWALTFVSSFWHVAYASDGLKFFDKRYWQRLEDQTYNNMIKEGKLTISAGKAEYPFKAVLRFIPKGEGFRPLIIVQSESDILKQWNVRAFLNCVIRKYEWKFIHRGHLQDVITNLQKFANLRKLNKISKLYFVRVDIDDAFGSINHNKLQLILKRILHSLIPKHCRIKELKFGKLLKAGYLKEFLDYQFRNEKCAAPKGFHFISQTERDVRELIALLEASSNIAVRYRAKNHVMTQGVGQGVKISSFLSEVYFRDMVETHFSSFLANPHDCLLRYADDILLITPDQDRARLFLGMTKAGFPDYICRINPTKTHTNVDGTEGSSLVRYLGGVIDLDHLTLTPFFRNHVKGRVKSMKLDNKTRLYRVMKAKSVLFSCGNICGSRNDPWFLDLRVNGKEVVLKTIEEGTFYLTQRLIDTEALLGGVPSPKLITWRILEFSNKIAKSCRRIFDVRFSKSGKAVSDLEIEMAVFMGVLRDVSPLKKWERVRLALHHKLRELRATADDKQNA